MPITPNDISNPKRKSGYNHVSVSHGGNHRPRPFYAEINRGGGRNVRAFRGPRRRSALEAAWDYCNYINGSPAVPATPAYPQPDVDMGGAVRRSPAKPPVEIIRNEWTGATDLYDVVLYDAVTAAIFRRKVGITARGTKRYADIARTFGFSIRPMCKAVTFKTKTQALKAETAKIAEVDSQPGWRRVGKECWAPQKEV